MEKMSNKREYEIPAGYEARIDGNKVIIVPKESEDERIKRWIIEYIQETLDVDGFLEGHKTMAKNAIAWLKKQGEQTPVIEMKTPEESLGVDSDTYNKIVDECVYGGQKPAWWTAEDEEELKKALNTLEEAGQYSSAKWLKNVCLVPQTMQKLVWKPTNEQINALYERVLKGGCCNGELMSLYNDLLKLKE